MINPGDCQPFLPCTFSTFMTSAEQLAQGLSKLPRIDIERRIALYVKEQQRNAIAYRAAGKAYVESWDKENRSCLSSAPGNLQEGKTKEGKVVVEAAGLGTPILKPRNPRHAAVAPSSNPQVERHGEADGSSVNGVEENPVGKSSKKSMTVAAGLKDKASGRATKPPSPTAEPDKDALEHQRRESFGYSDGIAHLTLAA